MRLLLLLFLFSLFFFCCFYFLLVFHPGVGPNPWFRKLRVESQVFPYDRIVEINGKPCVAADLVHLSYKSEEVGPVSLILQSLVRHDVSFQSGAF